jgi:hypothetical protein
MGADVQRLMKGPVVVSLRGALRRSNPEALAIGFDVRHGIATSPRSSR